MASRFLLQRQVYKIAGGIAIVCMISFLSWKLITVTGGSSPEFSRLPAGTAITDFTPEQIAKAEWSVSSMDFENSDPGRGRSYFDYVFSKTVGDKRIYDVPYPFQKVMARVNQYMGFDGVNDSALKVVLFPLGRSLQRNAALLGGEKYDMDLFFRYPRVVMGVEKESKAPPFSLNLKGRMYLGFHEKSKVIEAISYNDNEGRYEYQIVRDYEPGKTPTVVYANRQLCLTCHQNQTPIFSKSPWSETNAHPEISSRLESALGKNEYFGVPTTVDLSAPYVLDTLVGQGNYFHAFQKMWLSLCQTLECKQTTVKMLVRYLLNGEGVQLPGNQAQAYLSELEQQFRSHFPNGLKIPDPKIPNREPLKDRGATQEETEKNLGGVKKELKGDLQTLISRSNVPGALEPLTIRAPLEIWMSTEPDARNTNKMIAGFTDFFTQEDTKALDRWLAKKVAEPGFQDSQLFSSTCSVQQIPQAGGMDVQVVCPVKADQNLALQSGYFVIRKGQIEKGVVDNLFFYPSDSSCERRTAQTTQNRVSGTACPAVLHADARGVLNGDILQIQMFRSTGVNARLIDGRLLSVAQLNIKTGQFGIKIYNDMAILDQLIGQIQFLDPVLKKTVNSPFNRKYLLKSFAQFFGARIEDPDVEGKMNTLEKNLDVEAISEKDFLDQIKNPVDGFSHSCSMCHYNFEGVPPAFLGLKQTSIDNVGKCQRIELCAARILYRLKMRNCPPDRIAKFQKNPMPIQQFFNVVHIDVGVWQQKAAPSLIGLATQLVRPQELIQYLVSQGVAAPLAQQSVDELVRKDCPNVDYSIYESLPRCEFSHLRTDSLCSGLMKSYESN